MMRERKFWGGLITGALVLSTIIHFTRPSTVPKLPPYLAAELSAIPQLVQFAVNRFPESISRELFHTLTSDEVQLLGEHCSAIDESTTSSVFEYADHARIELHSSPLVLTETGGLELQAGKNEMVSLQLERNIGIDSQPAFWAFVKVRSDSQYMHWIRATQAPSTDASNDDLSHQVTEKMTEKMTEKTHVVPVFSSYYGYFLAPTHPSRWRSEGKSTMPCHEILERFREKHKTNEAHHNVTITDQRR